MRRNKLKRSGILCIGAGIDCESLVHALGVDHLHNQLSSLRVNCRRSIDGIVNFVTVHYGRHFEGAVSALLEQVLIIIVARPPHSPVIEPDEVGIPLVDALLAEKRRQAHRPQS